MLKLLCLRSKPHGGLADREQLSQAAAQAQMIVLLMLASKVIGQGRMVRKAQSKVQAVRAQRLCGLALVRSSRFVADRCTRARQTAYTCGA
jgi:hypothetical protein